MSYPEPAGSSGALGPTSTGTEPRTSEQIRSDIQSQREHLGHSVEALRHRVTELTDWRRQAREHRDELLIGAAVAGFVVGGMAMLRRRRRR